MIAVSHHTQVCLDAFVNCGILLEGLKKRKGLTHQMDHLLNECARICAGTFHAIKNRSVNANQLALLCIGICDECAEACDRAENKMLFQQCAQACRYCSISMSDLALSALD